MACLGERVADFVSISQISVTNKLIEAIVRPAIAFRGLYHLFEEQVGYNAIQNLPEYKTPFILVKQT